jgi:hypothetical protein
MGKLLRFVSQVLGRGESSRVNDDPDGAVLTALRANGADLDQPTHVLFYVYAPTEAGANRIAERGRDATLGAEVRPSASGDGTWLCLLQGTFVPTLVVLRQYRDRFESLAAAEGGEYDGWEAAVTK